MISAGPHLLIQCFRPLLTTLLFFGTLLKVEQSLLGRAALFATLLSLNAKHQSVYCESGFEVFASCDSRGLENLSIRPTVYA